MKLTKKKILQLCLAVEIEVLEHEFEMNIMHKGDGFLIQLVCLNLRDTNTGEFSNQKGGKYYISSHAIPAEVVGTLWKATQDFIIHEAREGFLYKGKRIFGPHWNPDELAFFCKGRKEIKRN